MTTVEDTAPGPVISAELLADIRPLPPVPGLTAAGAVRLAGGYIQAAQAEPVQDALERADAAGWRHGRPFTGGLLMLAAGLELALSLLLGPKNWLVGPEMDSPLQLVLAAGLIGCGLATWLHPVRRTPYAIAGILLSVGALLTADLGGFLAGAMLGAAGGALGFGWVPAAPGPDR